MEVKCIKTKAETIARTVVLALALLNQVLAICGKGQIQIAENDIYQIVSLTFTAVAAVWSWWKNNSFTQNAIKADEYLNELKNN